MALLTGNLQKSLSRLELSVASIVIFIIAAVFLRQILIMAARAERYFLEASVININTALQHRAGLFKLTGQKHRLAEMNGMNPFLLMQTAVEVSIDVNKSESLPLYTESQYRVLPSKYQGEVDYLDVHEIEAGNWYFDRSQRELVYRVSNDEYFYSENSEIAVIRFRVTLKYADNNSNGQYDPEIDTYSGIEFKKQGDFRWEI